MKKYIKQTNRMDPPAGYREIAEELGLDEDKDKEAATLLNMLLPEKEKSEDIKTPRKSDKRKIRIRLRRRALR